MKVVKVKPMPLKGGSISLLRSNQGFQCMAVNLASHKVVKVAISYFQNVKKNWWLLFLRGPRIQRTAFYFQKVEDR